MFKAEHLKAIAVFSGLILVGIGGRFLFLDVPNFSPTASVAIFAGFYFATRRIAILVPLVVLALSNLWLDAYTTWGELIVVAVAFLFPVLLSRTFRKGEAHNRSMRASGMVGCAVLPSVVFFATTNFAVWYFNGCYAPTWAGLSSCFVHALPFYQFTLAGDVLFTTLLLGGYCAATQWVATRRRALSSPHTTGASCTAT